MSRQKCLDSLSTFYISLLLAPTLCEEWKRGILSQLHFHAKKEKEKGRKMNSFECNALVL